MPGKVRVVNETDDGNGSYESGFQFQAIMGTGRAPVPVGGEFTFQNVSHGRHDLNFDSGIKGVKSGHTSINISDDFDDFLCKVSMKGLDWKISVVPQ